MRLPVPSLCWPPAVVPRTAKPKVPATVVEADVCRVSVEFGELTLTLVGEKDAVTPVGVLPVQPTKLKVTGSSLLAPLPV